MYLRCVNYAVYIAMCIEEAECKIIIMHYHSEGVKFMYVHAFNFELFFLALFIHLTIHYRLELSITLRQYTRIKNDTTSCRFL